MTGGYQALHEGAAWLDVSSRGKIVVTGEDRARLLHALSTNHVQRLQPGQGCYAFFLSAQGRILADAALFARPGQFLLDTEPEIAARLTQHIDSFIIADDAQVADASASQSLLAIAGPGSESILASLGAPIPAEPFDTANWDEKLIARASLTGGPGFLLYLPLGSLDAVAARLSEAGAIAATPEDVRTVRIESGKPRYGEDISERFLAQETALEHAVSFQKGCYLGQEIVERVRSRGQIHRVLGVLEIDSQTLPPPGTKLQAAGRDAAEITSAALSPRLGKTVALAYVRTEFARPGAVLTWNGVEAVYRSAPARS